MIERFLRRISVRGRLLLLFFLIVALLVSRVVLNAQSSNATFDQLSRAANVEARAGRLLLQSSRFITSSQLNLLRYIQDYAPSPYEALDDAVSAAAAIREALALESIESGELTVLLDALDDYELVIADLQTAREASENQTATRLEFQAYRLGNDISSRLERLVAQSEERVNTVTAQAIATARNDLQANTLSGVGILIATLVLIILVSASITRPIAALRAGAEEFRTRRAATQVDERGADELASLAQTFNQITAELSQTYTELEQRVVERTEELERRAVQLRTTAEVAREATQTTELDLLLNRSVTLIQTRFDFYHVSLFLLDDSRKNAVLRAATGEAGQAMLLRAFKMRVGDVGIVGFVASAGEARVVNDVNTDFVYMKHPLLPLTRSELALPLKAAGAVIGVLDVQSVTVNAFQPDDIEILQILADQLAVAIQNSRLLNELQTNLKEASTLYQRFTEEAWSRSTRSQKAGGYEYDLSQITTTQRAFDDSTIHRLQTGKPIAVQEISPDGVEKRAALLAPLMMFGQMIGVIGVEEEAPEHAWSEEQTALIAAITNQVALALDNARLLEETQVRNEQIRLLQEITAAAASNVKLTEMLQEVAQKVRRGFDLHRCAVLIFEPGASTALMVADASADEAAAPAVRNQQMPVSNNPIAQEIIRSRRPLVLPSLQESQLVAPLLPHFQARGTNAMVVCPLILRGDVIGAIRLEMADTGRNFDDEDIRLLEQIGLQTAAAVDVARSFEETVRRAEREQKIGDITNRIRETLDIETMLKTAVLEVQRSLGLPEVVIRISEEAL